MIKKLRCIVFRTGGTNNFKWHRSVQMFEDDAKIALISVRRTGYLAYNVDYGQSVNVGLPDTFEYSKSDNPNKA